MNLRQWVLVAIIALVAGALGGFVTGVFAGGVNFYIYTPNNNSEMSPVPEPPQPPASTPTDQGG